jgi:hypothetical protein
MNRKEATDLWTASRETLDKAYTVRNETIASAKAECRAKVREANVAFQHANEAYHRAHRDWCVTFIAEMNPVSLDLLLDENCYPGTDSMLAKWGYTKPDGTLSRWSRKIQAHARKMKEEGRL